MSIKGEGIYSYYHCAGYSKGNQVVEISESNNGE